MLLVLSLLVLGALFIFVGLWVDNSDISIDGESIKSQRDTYAEKETSLIEKLMSLKPDEREPYLEWLNKYTNEKTRLSVFLEQESKWWDLIIVTNEGVDLNFRYDKESGRNRVVNEIIGRSTPTYAE